MTIQILIFASGFLTGFAWTVLALRISSRAIKAEEAILNAIKRHSYGPKIRDEAEVILGRKMSLGELYTILERLSKKKAIFSAQDFDKSVNRNRWNYYLAEQKESSEKYTGGHQPSNPPADRGKMPTNQDGAKHIGIPPTGGSSVDELPNVRIHFYDYDMSREVSSASDITPPMPHSFYKIVLED